MTGRCVFVCYPLFQRQARRSWPALYMHVKRRYKGLIWTVEEMTMSDCESVVTVEDSAGHFDWCDQKLLMVPKCVSPSVQLITWSRICLEEITVSSLMKCTTYYGHNRICKTPLQSLFSHVTKPRTLYFISVHFSRLPPPTSCTWSRLSKFSYWSLKLRRSFSSLPGVIGLRASLPHLVESVLVMLPVCC
jgi:hypothetical protein